MYVGINIILTLSLNLINGYMGEFSVGHAGFMAIGAYVASFLTVKVFPTDMAAWLFPLAVIAGGMSRALSASSSPFHHSRHGRLSCHRYTRLRHDCQIRH